MITLKEALACIEHKAGRPVERWCELQGMFVMDLFYKTPGYFGVKLYPTVDKNDGSDNVTTELETPVLGNVKWHVLV